MCKKTNTQIITCTETYKVIFGRYNNNRQGEQMGEEKITTAPVIRIKISPNKNSLYQIRHAFVYFNYWRALLICGGQ